jgi:hypothetical protein
MRDSDGGRGSDGVEDTASELESVSYRNYILEVVNGIKVVLARRLEDCSRSHVRSSPHILGDLLVGLRRCSFAT